MAKLRCFRVLGLNNCAFALFVRIYRCYRILLAQKISNKVESRGNTEIERQQVITSDFCIEFSAFKFEKELKLMYYCKN